MSQPSASEPGPVQQRIEAKLQEAFAPEFLEVVNESHQHSVPRGSETHFKVIVVSQKFHGQSRVHRQRQIYQVLAEELQGPVHALSQRLFSSEEWAERKGSETFASPDCAGRGGAKI